MKRSYLFVLTAFFSLFVFWAVPVLGGDHGMLNADIDGGKDIAFVSYNWGDGSTGIPDSEAAASHKIRSLTIKRKPDENSRILHESMASGNKIPSMSLKVSDSVTLQMQNVTVVNITNAGGTTDKAGPSEVVKLGFEKLMVPAGS